MIGIDDTLNIGQALLSGLALDVFNEVARDIDRIHGSRRADALRQQAREQPGAGADVGDIHAGVECSRLHGVVVSSHSQVESERIPRLVRGRSCGKALTGNPRSNKRRPHLHPQHFTPRTAVAHQP